MVVLVLVVLLSAIVSAANPEIDQMLRKKQWESNAISRQLRPKVEADPTDASASNQLDPEFVKEYGGAYLDSDGILNINLVGDGKNIKAFLKDADVRYHEVNYTLAYLKDLQEVISPKTIDLGISVLGVDEKSNRVVVYFNQYSDEKVNALKKIIDSPAIQVMKTDAKVELTLGGGSEISQMKDSRQTGNESLLLTFLMKSVFLLASALWWVKQRHATAGSQ